MFDPTKEIYLEPKWQKIYQLVRLVVYLLIFSIFLFIAHLFLFPSGSFSFSFQSPGSSKNDIIDPRNSEDILPPEGKIGKSETLTFYAIASGNYSEEEVEIFLESDSKPGKEMELTTRKVYRALFYPLGSPLGFKDGTLLKNSSGYFIVSGGKMRKFASPLIVRNLGCNPNSFIEVLEENLGYNEKGEEIKKNDYPDDTIFKIVDEFYQLKGQKLQKFVSEKAFLSQYSKDLAIEKNEEFLKQYAVSEDYTGFSEGTLLSFGGSVFVVSNGTAIPIQDAAVFESMGFDWNKIIPAAEEEIGIYPKQKVLNLTQPHPDATVFNDSETGKYYYIQNGTKREIGSKSVADSYNFSNIIGARGGGKEEKGACKLKNKLFGGKYYECKNSIKNLGSASGNNYRFEAKFNSDLRISDIRAALKQSISLDNLNLSLIDVKNRIIGRYYGK